LFSALASIKSIDIISKSVWRKGAESAKIEGYSQSNVQLINIERFLLVFKEELFQSTRGFLVSTSYFKTDKAVLETQSVTSVRLGRKLLIEAA